MPAADRAARVNVRTDSPWINRHQNVVQRFDRLYDVWNPANSNADIQLDDLKLTIAALQQILADAIRDNTTLRAIGGGWSLSEAAVTDGRLVNTQPLNWYLPIGPTGGVAGYPSDPSHLVYFQCGTRVKEVNTILATQLDRPLALKTTGASNGQTIAGAVSTGTHGSRFRFGAMQDYVVGIHLIVAPDRTVWLERVSRPVLSAAVVAQLGAELVRDDTLFNSALVSFGSFGLIVGLLIEAEPLYLLEASRHRVPIDAALKHTMDSLEFPAGQEPFHFEVVVNPHDIAGGAYVTNMYQSPYRSNYPRPPVSPAGLAPGDDAVAFIGKLGDQLPAIVGPLVNLLVASEYKSYDEVFGTPGEIFDTNTDLQKEMSAEIGVPFEQASRALEIMLAAPQVHDYPGLLAFRWVKGSDALLAFTKFATTCAIELPAAYASRTVDFYDAVWQGLESAGIPHTLHWGQMNNFTPERVRAMYGGAVDDWIASRNTLLTSPARAVFSSPFLRQCGLG
jgi:hypothetical protein